MTVAQLLQAGTPTAFSFEVLPPLKGNSIERVFETIDALCEFNPAYINITTHRSEYIYKTTEGGLYRRVSQRTRPGTVAVAAAIRHKYNIPTVPHIICSGFTPSETEYALIDLDFLGITDLLVLRGDKAKHDARFVPAEDGYSHAIELQGQIARYNQGVFLEGETMKSAPTPFSYGVAGYPEKHEESPNFDTDIHWLKEKVNAGAEYIVTQMFFDNQKFFDFVARCRAEGITVPIVPGLKPITTLGQLSVLPKIFHVDMPQELTAQWIKCKDDAAVKTLGVEWCVAQARELKAAGVPSIHFYSLSAIESVRRIAQQIY